MCRWLVYASASGDSHRPMRLADVLSKPAHSLIQQAYRAGAHVGFTARNNAVMNADGFGLSWFALDGRRAFLFKSSQPAWSDKNLMDITAFAESYVIFGHVRAASPGSIVGFENTHPFRHGRLVFQHNGHIEEFGALRRRFSSLLSDEAFGAVKGLTDSEHAFALLLTHLRDCGRAEPFAPAELAEAMEQTIAAILLLLKEAGVTGGFTSANFAVTDGETVVVTRFCDKFPSIPPPSLYFAFPTAAELRRELGGDDDASAAAEPGDGSTNCSAAAAAAAGPPGPEEEDGGPCDTHGVDSARWARDEAFLAAAWPSARARAARRLRAGDGRRPRHVAHAAGQRDAGLRPRRRRGARAEPLGAGHALAHVAASRQDPTPERRRRRGAVSKWGKRRLHNSKNG